MPPKICASRARTPRFSLGATFATWAQPSTDAIQEVAIQTSNYAAEFGQAGGGVFNLTMRSGTNQYHGSAYEYWSNEALNAGQPFTNNGSGGLIRTRTRKNDWGLTGGGPVWIPKVYNGRNKTFFFFAWENLPSSSINDTTFNQVPIAAYRTGDFSQAITAVNSRNLGTDPLGRPIIQNAIYDPNTQRPASPTDPRLIRDPFVGNMIQPARFDPVAVKVQALVPAANLPGLINNEVNPFPVSSRYWIPSLKLDHQLSARQKLSFFWSLTRTASPYSAGAPIGGGAEGFPLPISEADSNSYSSHRFTLNYDYSVTPTMLLHLGMGYMDSWLTMPSHTTDYNATTQLGLTGPFTPFAFPNFLGMTSSQGGLKNLGNIFQGQQNTGLEKPTGVATLTWVKNNHTYKFGGELRLEGYPNYNNLGTNGVFTFSANETALPYLNSATVPGTGASVGFPYASFLLGLVDNGNVKVPAVARMGKSHLGLYAQDTWKVTRKLTLDYGLRYDYSTYPKEQYGRIPTFSPTTPDPSAGNRPGAAIYESNCNCSFAKNYPWAFGPRLGVAYQISSKWVLRARSRDCLQRHGGQRHRHPLGNLVKPVHLAFLRPAGDGPVAGRAVDGVTDCVAEFQPRILPVAGAARSPVRRSIRMPGVRPDSINGASGCSARLFGICWWRPRTWATAGFGGTQTAWSITTRPTRLH